MSDREALMVADAPKPAGPYSHAVRSGGLLFCSGQIPVDPATDMMVGEGSVAEQTRRCLDNLAAVCDAAGTSLAKAVRMTVYLTDMGRFQEMNGVYVEYFASEPPARAAIGVVALPKGALVEIDAVVALDS